MQPVFLFYLYFLALGLVSSFFQMVFLREILVSFRGNELFLNYFLISWLVFVGLGSLIKSRWLKSEGLGKFVSVYYFAISTLGLAFFFGLRLLPKALNFTAEIPDLKLSLIFLPLCLLPTCLLLGMGFSWVSKYFDALISKPTAFNVNRAYLAETFGFFMGGLVFSFWLIKIPGLKLILMATIAGLIINFLISFYKKSAFVFINLLVIFIAGYFLISQADNYESATAAWRFPHEKVIKTLNSFFGNIAITEKNGQYNFYEQGALIVPEDFKSSEELIHLPLLFAEKPLRIFLIGGAWSGLLKEALEYPDLKIYYTELDPELIPAIYDFLPAETQTELKNPKVKSIKQDAFAYFKKNNEKFDFILLNLPAPATYQINRYYTEEFFEIARKNLNSNGIFAIALPYYSENLTNPNLNRFLNSIFGVFGRAFLNNTIIPAQKLILIGFENKNLKWEAGALAEKFKRRDFETGFLSADYVKYLLTNERREKILKEIAMAAGLSNTNRLPTGVIYWLISQIELSQPKVANFLNWLFDYRWFILGFTALAPLCLLFFIKRYRPEAKIKFVAYSASSLALILEIIFIFSWQVNIGYLYHQISLIIALVMLGIFLANFYLSLKPPENKEKMIKFFLLLLLVLTAILPIVLLSFKYQSLFFVKSTILTLSLFSGFLAGAIYPLANFLYLEKQPLCREDTGKIYGLELLGGGLLLIVFSLFILPFFGLLAVACFLVYWVLMSFLAIHGR